MIDRVIVLGGGSAGFLAAISLKTRLPQLEVTLIRSPGIGIIGVGEGSVATFPLHLHGYLGINPAEFYQAVNPTWKLGIRFEWGARDYFNYTFRSQIDTQYKALPKGTGFYSYDDFTFGDTASGLMSEGKVFLRDKNNVPLIGPDTAYHLENKRFVAFLETHARNLGVQLVEDTVLDVEQNDAGVTGLRLESGNTAEADLFVDCSGFRSELLHKVMGEPFVSYKSSLFCERAVVGGWDRGKDEPIRAYTTAETMDAGWAWRIEHESHITRGYVYAPDFISDDEAEAEFRRKNPKLGPTRIVKFRSGRYRNEWVKNVVAIGNAGGFVEPLEATSLGVITTDCQALVETLHDCDRQLRPSLIKAFNRRSEASWEAIRQFLAIHYKFNTRLDTPFWKACRADTDIGQAEEIVEYYQENGPSTIWRTTLIQPLDQFKLDGYLTMLVGMKVPFKSTHKISKEEWGTWQQIRQSIKRDVDNAYTCEDAMALVKSPAWRWSREFFLQHL